MEDTGTGSIGLQDLQWQGNEDFLKGLEMALSSQGFCPYQCHQKGGHLLHSSCQHHLVILSKLLNCKTQHPGARKRPQDTRKAERTDRSEVQASSSQQVLLTDPCLFLLETWSRQQGKNMKGGSPGRQQL